MPTLLLPTCCFQHSSSAKLSKILNLFLLYNVQWITRIYYTNFNELQGFLLLWQHDIFTCDVICATKYGPFNCWTNLILFLCDGEIFEDYTRNIRQPLLIFGNLQISLEIFRKWSEMFVWASDSPRRIFKNLRKTSEYVRKSSGTQRWNRIYARACNILYKM